MYDKNRKKTYNLDRKVVKNLWEFIESKLDFIQGGVQYITQFISQSLVKKYPKDGIISSKGYVQMRSERESN